VAKLIALVLPLGLDTFAVAAGIGMTSGSAVGTLRLSLLFSAFAAGMPLIGLALGAPIGHAVGGVADYVAIGVLLAFGLYTLLVADERDEERLANAAAIRGVGALVLGIGISLDELAIGFTLGLHRGRRRPPLPRRLRRQSRA
jgi:putative Mn2+ efflux pump MntP